jgi:iron complex transport system substrate-binding protein
MAWLAARGTRALAWCEEPAAAAREPAPFDLADITARALDLAGSGGRASGAAESAAARIVTLAPSNAEIVAALGAFARVIACEDSSDHPPEVATRERLGPDLGPDLDRVAALAPDLVLSSLSVPGMERVVTGLAVRGVPQLVLAPRSLDEVLDDVRRVGHALGVAAAAAAVVAAMEAERAALRAMAPAEPVPVYLEWWPRPMFTPGADCYSNELIALAGGRNVFAGRPGSSLEIRADELVAAAPAACFVSWCGVSEAKLDVHNLIGRAGLKSLAAARAGRVAALDEALSGRPGPRMLAAARRMRAALVGFGLLHDPGA